MRIELRRLKIAKASRTSRAQALDRKRAARGRADIVLGFRYETVHGRGQTDGQIAIFGNQLFSLADQIELLTAHP